MELFTLLKKFQRIEPHGAYTEHSKSVILSMPRIEPEPTAWAEVIRLFGTRPVWMTATAMMIIVVGVGVFLNLSPNSTISSLDPVTLKAEADAIDIQIQLTNLTYNEPLRAGSGESTTPVAVPLKKEVREQAAALGLTSASSTNAGAPNVITVDEALDKLISE